MAGDGDTRVEPLRVGMRINGLCAACLGVPVRLSKLQRKLLTGLLRQAMAGCPAKFRFTGLAQCLTPEQASLLISRDSPSFFKNSLRTISSPQPHPWQGYQCPREAQVSQNVVTCFQVTHAHPAMCLKQLRGAYNARYNVMEIVICYVVG